MKIHRSIEITAMPERIWPLLVEPKHIMKWCTPIRTLRHTGKQHSGLGAGFYFEEMAVGRLMKLNFVVTEWVVNEKFTFRMTTGNFVKGYEQRYTIEGTPTGSRFTCFEDVKLPYGIVGKIAGFFRKSTSESLLDGMLLNLKRMAES
jgi:uncharacterized protein YndB with AHSA1/START domain